MSITGPSSFHVSATDSQSMQKLGCFPGSEMTVLVLVWSLCVLIDWLLNSASSGKRQEGLDPVSHWCFVVLFGQNCDAAQREWSLWLLISPQNDSPPQKCKPRRAQQAPGCRQTGGGVRERSCSVHSHELFFAEAKPLFSHSCVNIDNYQLSSITACW